MRGRQDKRRLAAGPFFPVLEDRFVRDVKEFRASGSLEEAWILVPSLDIRRRLRRRLAAAGSAFNARFALFPDLAREILAAAPDSGGGNRALLDNSAAQVLLRGLVERSLPPRTYFGAVKNRGGFIEALGATLDDLDHAGIEPAAIRAASRRADSPVSARKMSEIADLLDSWFAILDARGYRTAAGFLKDAARTAASFPPPRLWIYGFYDLNGVQRGLLEALVRNRDVSFYLPEVEARDAAYAAPLREWLVANGFESAAETIEVKPPRETVLVSAAGERRESEEVARRILRLLASGARPGGIAAVYRNPDPYAGTLGAVLARAGIPADLHDRPTLGETRAGRALRLFVHAALSNGSRREIMDFLDVVLPMHPEWSGDGVALAARWDVLSIEAGLSRGRDTWIPRLERLRDGRAEWPDRAIHAFVDAMDVLIRDFDAFLGAPAWGGRTAAVLDVAERWIGAEPFKDDVLEAVSALGDLDRTGEPAGAEAYRDALENRLARSFVDRTESAREAVHVGDVLSVRGLHFEHLFVLGMGEKVFPRAARQDPILLDRERLLLNGTGSNLALGSAGPDEETFLFALLRAAGERLTLSWSRIEPAESRPRLPSPFLMRTAGEISGEAVDYESLDRFVERVPLDLMARAAEAGRARPGDLVPRDPAAHLDPAAALDAAEFDTLVVAAAAGAAHPRRAAGICAESPVLLRALAGETARWRDRVFTKFDGFIESPEGRTALSSLAGSDGAYSASRLETYARCPFRYFVETFLGVRSFDNPEDLDGSNPMEKGTLVHEILREFLSAHHETPLRSLDRDVLRASLLEIADRRLLDFERDHPTGHPLRWAVEKDGLLDDLKAWLDFERDRPDGCVAAGFEVSFGMAPEPGPSDDPHASPEPATLALPGGRQVTFHGRIDRFDYDAVRHHARVVDYKSGRPPKGASPRGLNGGRNLQLPIYLHALSRLVPDLTSGEAEYVYLRNDPTPVRYAATDFASMRRELGTIVAPLIEGIEAGRFFPLPAGCGFRDTCGYGSICGVRVEERFERKRNDPRIATHPALPEGPSA